KTVAVLGLSFKAGTSDARKSPGVKLANLLNKAWATVSVYDPYANGEAREELRDEVTVCDSVLKAATDPNAVFVATAWPEFTVLVVSFLKTYMSGDVIYDADNALNRQKVQDVGLKYFAVGRG